MKANVTISRRSNDKVYISIQDDASWAEFVEVELTLESYAQLITGISSVEGNAEYRNLDVVGKTKIVEPRKVRSGVKSYDKKDHQKWLNENCQEEGWILNDRMSSQRSVVRDTEGNTWLNYSVYKFV